MAVDIANFHMQSGERKQKKVRLSVRGTCRPTIMEVSLDDCGSSQSFQKLFHCWRDTCQGGVLAVGNKGKGQVYAIGEGI